MRKPSRQSTWVVTAFSHSCPVHAQRLCNRAGNEVVPRWQHPITLAKQEETDVSRNRSRQGRPIESVPQLPISVTPRRGGESPVIPCHVLEMKLCVVLSFASHDDDLGWSPFVSGGWGGHPHLIYDHRPSSCFRTPDHPRGLDCTHLATRDTRDVSCFAFI